MKITKIVNNTDLKHTYDIEVLDGHQYLLSNGCVSHNTSGKCISATPGIDAPKQLKSIEEGTYSLPFTVPGLREYRQSYETLFTIDNRNTIELAAIRQRFVCMSQSVSLAYTDTSSAHALISDIIYAESLGVKTLYYTHSQKGELTEVCESCSS